MKTPAIIPAIIPESLEHITSLLTPFAGILSEVQIDIVDGIFVPPKSWPYVHDESHIESLTTVLPEGIRHELDLMISEPRDRMMLWLATKPSRVVLHVESLSSDSGVSDAIGMIRESGSLVVLSANNDTTLSRVLAHGADIDGVQCMGIAEIGAQGNPFDERVLEHIALIRAAHPEMSISVDGSVNKETIIRLRDAGADRFIVGSAIFNTEDPVAAYREFVDLVA